MVVEVSIVGMGEEEEDVYLSISSDLALRCQSRLMPIVCVHGFELWYSVRGRWRGGGERVYRCRCAFG